MMEVPRTGKSILIGISLVIVAIIAVYAMMGWLTIALGAALVAVAAYILYILLVNGHRWATNLWQGGNGGRF